MMKGEWVILLWALLGTVFLVKTTPVSGLVRKVRRQPSAVQAAVALCLLVAVITGGTKPGGTNELSSSSQPAFFAPENSSLIIQQSSLIPGGWPYDPTDTDGDGIPDLWEKWTHGNRQVADGGIDRDGDGLTELEEFQNQTDPRTADTDGDGFDDAFEAGHGMNPLVQEDFTPVEPDENQNGFIDLWENEPYLYGFTDTNHNGFDDYYEAYYLEPESEDNYDVVVDVCTTRSAALTWTVGALTEGVVLPATAMTSVRLRLPFGEDAQIALLSSPEGTPPPPGGLWKSRVQVAFSPRSGQSLHGNALVSPDGMIAHKVVIRDSAICRFEPPPSGIQTLSSAGAGGVGPSTDIKAGMFEVDCADQYHDVGDEVGAFTVTSLLGMEDAIFEWASEYGGMQPDSGMESWLTVARLPETGENLTVVTTAKLDSESRVAVTSIVTKCDSRIFSFSLSTNNFSPHLGETLGVEVTIPGCGHTRDPGWLEIEVVREVVDELQHVASMDMDPQTPGLDRYLETSALGGQSLSFAWDGIAQVGLPLADHPDVFTGPVGSFHRAMPAMTAGDPVPPPFYTLRVRLWDQERNETLEESAYRVYVPQVVNIVPFGGETEFQEPVYGVGSNGTEQVLLYPGCTAAEADAALAQLPQMAMAFFPSDVNLRIVMSGTVNGAVKGLAIVGESSKDSRRGDASGFRKRNERPDGEMAIYVAGFQKSLKNNYNAMLNGNRDQVPIPMPPEQFAKYIAPTVAHEVGHSLGLVDPDWLLATPNDKQRLHNKVQTWLKMMDWGGLYYVKHRLNPDPDTCWRPDNLRYLRFVLPKGE